MYILVYPKENVLVGVSGLLAELSKTKEEYTGVVVIPQENRIMALSASSSDSGLGKNIFYLV